MIDGESSFAEIEEALEGKVKMASLLTFAQQLVKLGLITV
jgi:hypothetical protein